MRALAVQVRARAGARADPIGARSEGTRRGNTPAADRPLRHEYVALDEGSGLRLSDRDELRALSTLVGPPTFLPDLVECLARGGVVPARHADGRPARHRYGYLLVRDATGIVAAAPALSTTEVLFDVLAEGGLLRAAGDLVRAYPKRLGARTLVIGTPLCQDGGALARPGSDAASSLRALEAGARAVARELGCHALLWKDIDAAGLFRGALINLGYRDFPTLPAAFVQLSPHATLHDYFGWIGSVASYGDLRRKMQAGAYDSPGLRDHLGVRSIPPAERATRALRTLLAARRSAPISTAEDRSSPRVVFEVVRSPSDAMLAQMRALYAAQVARAELRWERLAEPFFRHLAALPEASFAIARTDATILGFSASIQVGRRFVALRSGILAGAARALSLPVLLILRDIETALTAGCREILLGPTGYTLKARFGATFSPRVGLLRLLPPWSLLTRPVAAAIRRGNRRAGVADLHRIDFKSAYAPQLGALRGHSKGEVLE